MKTLDPGRVDALLQFYETIAPARVSDFGAYYAENAYFKDPFNEVHRLEDIKEIFARMFVQTVDPKFSIRERMVDGGTLIIIWDLSFRLRAWTSGEIRVIQGMSHLRFDEAGKVHYHRDYWDTVEELYAKLPVIGIVARVLRRLVG